MFRLPSSKEFFIAIIFSLCRLHFLFLRWWKCSSPHMKNLVFSVFLLDIQEFYCQPNIRGCPSGMGVPSVVPPFAKVSNVTSCRSYSRWSLENVPHFNRESFYPGSIHQVFLWGLCELFFQFLAKFFFSNFFFMVIMRMQCRVFFIAVISAFKCSYTTFPKTYKINRMLDFFY